MVSLLDVSYPMHCSLLEILRVSSILNRIEAFLQDVIPIQGVLVAHCSGYTCCAFTQWRKTVIWVEGSRVMSCMLDLEVFL